MKSVILINEEKPYTEDFAPPGKEIYHAPYTLSDEDQSTSYSSLGIRMYDALAKSGRLYHYARWGLKTVVYSKERK